MAKEDMIHIYNRIFLSHKKEWSNAFCSNMGGLVDYHTKWSKSKRNIIWYCLYAEKSLKTYNTNELIYKTESNSENKLMGIREGCGGGIGGKFGIDMYTLLYLK